MFSNDACFKAKMLFMLIPTRLSGPSCVELCRVLNSTARIPSGELGFAVVLSFSVTSLNNVNFLT